MSQINVKAPEIVSPLLADSDFRRLETHFKNMDKSAIYFDQSMSRYIVADNNDPILGEYAKKLTSTARKVFNSPTLVPSYTLFAHYEGPNAQLWKHKDDNACTYTLDMCVYQKEPWGLWVDDSEYMLHPNEALAYFGNDQLHWRGPFPNPYSNHVAMIFFHFVEPEHWYYAEGPDYLEVIRSGQINM